MRIGTIIGALALAVIPALPVQAAIVVNSGSFSYSQNFDSLGSSGSSNGWTNDGALAGWYLFNQTAGGTPITAYSAGDGSSNTGSFYSFGATSSSERALGGVGSGAAYFGSPASGAVAGWIAAGFTNSSGQILDSFTLGFDGEQWRNGGNASAQTMVLQYGFGTTFTGVSNWFTPGGNFNWSSTQNSATAAAVNGNVAGLVANRGGTISGLGWNSGDTLWLRWIETNDIGNDHGLAIDNVSFSASGAPAEVPLPAAYGLFIAGLAALRAAARRKA